MKKPVTVMADEKVIEDWKRRAKEDERSLSSWLFRTVQTSIREPKMVQEVPN